MLLAIDSGNTNTVFAVFDDEGALRGEWRGTTANVRTADEMGVWLIQLLGLAGIERGGIKAAVIATVVPAMLFNLQSMCRRYFNCEPMVVGSPNVDLGIKVRLDHPDEVGADRLVNAVAARAAYGGGPLVIVDFGTATTFDVVDRDGDYRGGAIAPGINLSLEALHMAAAKLPRVAIVRPERAIGTGTVSAMQSGIFWGYIGMIEGLIARISAELDQGAVTVVATGGLAPLFTKATDAIHHSDPELTLRGLLILHQRNQTV